ncbi:hypothetical protein BD309DRAFT_870275 [Dichomitus squalens]|uniref:Uncharacterized protein n=2 Tax=Dichomitus squalens TaxID=114155 RepID=A0A4Q9NL60_9APHY|nr:uncharacterized protein DICSQDRAFT_148796 [Dichomitus squalens LYAD-421 SS1]EJF58856.1 hypothetical protein DICSQDRAFT_148796 [Dichomitus squalens LYAD-421 SS1]TBU40421.1 hypothetical protein BD309DRAFT_870275 [Dichomitus squalens]TBU52637.1 hypothetical protein BD310DRAFT_952598 [Dichomitus squalens]
MSVSRYIADGYSYRVATERSPNARNISIKRGLETVGFLSILETYTISSSTSRRARRCLRLMPVGSPLFYIVPSGELTSCG